MPEFELDKESVGRAEKLSARMMDDLRMVLEKEAPFEMGREFFSDRRYAKEAEGVPIKDVVANVGQLTTELTLARRWDDGVLCLKLPQGEIAPISMTASLGWPFWPLMLPLASADLIEIWENFFPFPPFRFWRELVRQASRLEERFVVTSTREAEEGVGRGLNEFLSYRFAGMKKWAEWIQGIGTPVVGPGGGLQMQVSCRTHGLRIHISCAFFINWVFFGSPTTPVTSYVLPGRYIFAGDGPMLPTFTQDAGVFCIPPTYQATLTRF